MELMQRVQGEMGWNGGRETGGFYRKERVEKGWFGVWD